MIKKYVQFSLTSLGTLKHDFVINAIKVFNFLPLINNSVTIGLSFSLSFQQFRHQKLLILYSSLTSVVFLNNFVNILLFEYSIKALRTLKCLNPVLSLLLIKNWYFASYGSFAYKYSSSISLSGRLLNSMMHFFFSGSKTSYY